MQTPHLNAPVTARTAGNLRGRRLSLVLRSFPHYWAAQRLYDKHGFTVIAQEPPQLVLEWRARS
jgi:hypothetical protein